MGYFKCISDLDKLRFQGGRSITQKTFPSVWLKKCRGSENCKSEKEIDAFASNTYLNIYVKSSVYEPDQYDDDHVKASGQIYVQRTNFGENEKTFSEIKITE